MKKIDPMVVLASLSSPDQHTLPSDMNPCSLLNFLTCFENFLLYLAYNTSFKLSNTSIHFIASTKFKRVCIKCKVSFTFYCLSYPLLNVYHIYYTTLITTVSTVYHICTGSLLMLDIQPNAPA